jgi:hypothetical protein
LAHCAGCAYAWARLIIGQDVKSGEDRDIPEGRGLKMQVMRIPPPVLFILPPSMKPSSVDVSQTLKI